MTDQQIKDATKLAKRMRKLMNDAKGCNLNFVAIDDSISIGSIDIEDSWEELIGNGRSDEFISTGAFITGIGA